MYIFEIFIIFNNFHCLKSSQMLGLPASRLKQFLTFDLMDGHVKQNKTTTTLFCIIQIFKSILCINLTKNAVIGNFEPP